MKCWDSFIYGVFVGSLILCILMLNFPKGKQCFVEFGKGNVTHVLIGDYHE